MPTVYRGMFADASGQHPGVGNNSGNLLGIRTGVNADVRTELENGVPWVRPTYQGQPQGLSVNANDPCGLPAHRRPPGPPWNGTGSANLRIWSLNTTVLVPVQLGYVGAPVDGQPDHGLVNPGDFMPLAQYQGYIQGTQNSWALVAAPASPCPAAGDIEPEEESAPMSRAKDLAEGIDATAAGDDPDALVERVKSANEAGTSAIAIVAALEAGVARAESAGQEEGAEALRGLLDRITGFCSPHARIELR